MCKNFFSGMFPEEPSMPAPRVADNPNPSTGGLVRSSTSPRQREGVDAPVTSRRKTSAALGL